MHRTARSRGWAALRPGTTVPGVLAVLAAVAGCTAPSGSAAAPAVPTATTATTATSSATPSDTTAPDGTQGYGTLIDLYDAVVEGGVPCTDLTARVATPPAAAEATCGLAGGSLVLQIWPDAEVRDDATDNAIGARIRASTPFCVVLGNGQTGTWSVDGSADPAVCQQVFRTLGGRIYDSEGDLGSLPPTTSPAVTTSG